MSEKSFYNKIRSQRHPASGFWIISSMWFSTARCHSQRSIGPHLGWYIIRLSLIALVSLQGASAYTTSGRWQVFTQVSGSIPDVSIVILLFIYSCQVLQPGGGFGSDGAMGKLKTVIVLVSGSPPRHSRHNREASSWEGVFSSVLNLINFRW